MTGRALFGAQYPQAPDSSLHERTNGAAAAHEVLLLRQRIEALEHEVERRKKAEESCRFLAEVSAALGTSLDIETALSAVCELCVPRLAEWAAIDVLTDGTMKRVATAPPDSNALDADADGRAKLVVPLRDDGETVGEITLLAAQSCRSIEPSDVEVAHEIARRTVAAMRSARRFREAQAETRMRDEFLATLSHEMRTPLSAILGWVRMLRAGGLSPEVSKRALDAIERSSLAQAQLIDDLLDVSRVISGKLRLEVEELTLAPVVEAAIDAVRPAMQAKNIRFRHVVEPSAGPILGDAHRIQQVIWNLLNNAVKFTPKGGTVFLLVERAGDRVQLTVSDTGQGIAADVLPTIFERFKQADGGTARVHGGLGLGLAIARHIVELHGGTIEAHSDGEGRGAELIVRLPIAPVQREVVGPFRRPSRTIAKLHSERPVDLQGLTVLVVDDEHETRESLSEVLQQLGCSVLTASNAEEALAVLDRASPRIAVCDIGMPGMDGYGFIERVRQRPADQGGRIVAVALTGHAAADDRRRALRAGFQVHLSKPVEPAEFVRVLANVAQLGASAPD